MLSDDINLNPHDTVVMKKKHACGTNGWEIIRVGADIKLRCLFCKHVIMVDRIRFLSMAKSVLHRE